MSIVCSLLFVFYFPFPFLMFVSFKAFHRTSSFPNPSCFSFGGLLFLMCFVVIHMNFPLLVQVKDCNKTVFLKTPVFKRVKS